MTDNVTQFGIPKHRAAQHIELTPAGEAYLSLEQDNANLRRELETMRQERDEARLERDALLVAIKSQRTLVEELRAAVYALEQVGRCTSSGQIGSGHFVRCIKPDGHDGTHVGESKICPDATDRFAWEDQKQWRAKYIGTVSA